jgi:hypothetical protein
MQSSVTGSKDARNFTAVAVVERPYFLRAATGQPKPSKHPIVWQGFVFFPPLIPAVQCASSGSYKI